MAASLKTWLPLAVVTVASSLSPATGSAQITPPAGAALFVSTEANNGISTVSQQGVVSPYTYAGPKPYDLAFDALGNLYICNFGGGTVSKLSPGGVITTLATGLDRPAGVAINNATGEVFVAEFGGDRVVKIGTNLQVSTFANTVGPDSLAFDSLGNLYTANLKTDLSGDTITKMDSLGNTSVFAGGINTPNGLAFDTAGNLFVSNLQGSSITRIDPLGAISLWASSPSLLNGPAAMAFDSMGDLYVANFQGGNITRISADGSTLSNFATIGNTPIGLAFDTVPEPGTLTLVGIAVIGGGMIWLAGTISRARRSRIASHSPHPEGQGVRG
jgi:DNA-binding beta-propeller fold protein YncE